MIYMTLTAEERDAIHWTVFNPSFTEEQKQFVSKIMPYVSRLIEGWPMGETEEIKLHNALRDMLPTLVKAHKQYQEKLK